MNPKKIWANLVVKDLDRTTDFYTALGFKSNGRSADLTSFFFGESDFIIHFFLPGIIKKGFITEVTDSQKSNEIIFSFPAESKLIVNEWAKEVEKAGGKLISSPAEFGEKYYGFVFADP